MLLPAGWGGEAGHGRLPPAPFDVWDCIRGQERRFERGRQECPEKARPAITGGSGFARVPRAGPWSGSQQRAQVPGAPCSHATPPRETPLTLHHCRQAGKASPGPRRPHPSKCHQAIRPDGPAREGPGGGSLLGAGGALLPGRPVVRPPSPASRDVAWDPRGQQPLHSLVALRGRRWHREEEQEVTAGCHRRLWSRRPVTQRCWLCHLPGGAADPGPRPSFLGCRVGWWALAGGPRS